MTTVTVRTRTETFTYTRVLRLVKTPRGGLVISRVDADTLRSDQTVFRSGEWISLEMEVGG